MCSVFLFYEIPVDGVFWPRTLIVFIFLLTVLTYFDILLDFKQQQHNGTNRTHSYMDPIHTHDHHSIREKRKQNVERGRIVKQGNNDVAVEVVEAEEDEEQGDNLKQRPRSMDEDNSNVLCTPSPKNDDGSNESGSFSYDFPSFCSQTLVDASTRFMRASIAGDGLNIHPSSSSPTHQNDPISVVSSVTKLSNFSKTKNKHPRQTHQTTKPKNKDNSSSGVGRRVICMYRYNCYKKNCTCDYFTIVIFFFVRLLVFHGVHSVDAENSHSKSQPVLGEQNFRLSHDDITLPKEIINLADQVC